MERETSWIDGLHSSYQEIARRWETNVGLRIMNKIFDAMPKRGAGSPPREFSDEELTRTLEIHLAESEPARSAPPRAKASKPKTRKGLWAAAGVCAEERGITDEGEKANYQRAIVKRLEPYEKPTGEAMEHLARIAGAMEERGEKVRSDFFPAALQPPWIQSLRPILTDLGLKVEPQAVTPDPTGKNLLGQRVIRVQATMATREFLAGQRSPEQPFAFDDDVRRFFDAFRHILPEDMAASEVDQLYRRVEGFLREDIGLSAEVCTNP